MSLRLGAARIRLNEMLVLMPVMLPQTSKTVLLPDGSRWRWNLTTQCYIASIIMANNPMRLLAPRHHLCGGHSYLPRMICSHLLLRIRSTTSGRNQMIILRCSTLFHNASWPWELASKSSKRYFKDSILNYSNTTKSSETNLSVSLLLCSKELVLMRMCIGYSSTTTFWMFPLIAHCTIWRVDSAPKVQISHPEDGTCWLDGFSMVFVLGGYCSGTLEGGRMGDNLDFFVEILDLLLKCCLVY